MSQRAAKAIDDLVQATATRAAKAKAIAAPGTETTGSDWVSIPSDALDTLPWHVVDTALEARTTRRRSPSPTPGGDSPRLSFQRKLSHLAFPAGSESDSAAVILRERRSSEEGVASPLSPREGDASEAELERLLMRAEGEVRLSLSPPPLPPCQFPPPSPALRCVASPCWPRIAVRSIWSSPR